MEATAMGSLWGKGESELPVFSRLCVGTDRQLLHVEAEPRETKLIRVIQRFGSKSRTKTWVS